MTQPHHAPDVGHKFHADGSVRHFPGNTIICIADPAGQAYQDATWVQDELLKTPYSHKFAMLPPSSFHMTVFDLLCDAVRTPEKWSSKLALDAPLIQTDEFFIDAVQNVPAPDNFRMTFQHLNLGTNGLSLYLKPIDDAMNQLIRGYRDQLADATGVRQPNHDTYAFHLSLAYRILQTTDDEEAQLIALADRINARLSDSFGVFDTGQPMLTFFDDMFAFLPESERMTLTSRQA
jgi:hypothetical protein